MITYAEARPNAEKIADEVLKMRIIDGMELLKDKYGENWVSHIDPHQLNMSNLNQCVLGQLARHVCSYDYLSMVDELEIDGSDYGFDTCYANDTYEELTEVWQTIITP